MSEGMLGAALDTLSAMKDDRDQLRDQLRILSTEHARVITERDSLLDYWFALKAIEQAIAQDFALTTPLPITTLNPSSSPVVTS